MTGETSRSTQFWIAIRPPTEIIVVGNTVCLLLGYSLGAWEVQVL